MTLKDKCSQDEPTKTIAERCRESDAPFRLYVADKKAPFCTCTKGDCQYRSVETLFQTNLLDSGSDYAHAMRYCLKKATKKGVNGESHRLVGLMQLCVQYYFHNGES